ncbi:amine dehydrogenase large subunit [Hellea balneolensis]|uniref:amine dehydrogenase large subunit n=1 Tax=Hellea balneolensis TaxID=287478 RepID=UPI000420EFAD|nr:amine dehydrogenase large subunit [Hellea balneolensis]
MLTTSLAACVEGERPKSNSSASDGVVVSSEFEGLPELEIEEVGLVQELPSDYPSNYIFAHNMNFYSILDGNINIIDTAADTLEFKGMINAAQMASFAQSKSRNELYVSETYYSRGTHGKKTDVLTIYDMATLNIKDEILLPGGKRGQSVIQKGSLQLINDEKLALLWNFTPASSISVIDMVSREIVTEIPTPGCALTFPLRGAAFATLCGDGKVASFVIDGADVSRTISESFNDIDDDAMFMKSARVGNTQYFPTFTGNVRPISVGTEQAIPLEEWSLVTPAERKDNWRPSGWQVVTAQPNGNLFVLMQNNGEEGSHKAGGSEVWIFDVEAKKKIGAIKLDKGGLSIEATRGADGHLVVTNLEMGLEVYSFDGNLQRSIIVNDTATPFLLHAAK